MVTPLVLSTKFDRVGNIEKIDQFSVYRALNEAYVEYWTNLLFLWVILDFPFKFYLKLQIKFKVAALE